MDRADRFWSKISTFIKHPGQYWQHWVSLPFWNHVFNNVDAFQPNGAIQFPNLGGDLRHNWSNTSHLQLLQVQSSKESTSSYYLCFLQGSICLPGEAWSSTPGLGHVVVSAFEFYNGDNLLFPAFQTHPQSNLSSIISLSVDNNSKVELPQDGEPIRIRFNQVALKSNFILSDSHFLALISSRHQLWFLGLGESMVVWGRLRSESCPKQWNRNRVWLLPSDTIQSFHGLDGRVLWSPIFSGPRHYHKGTNSFFWGFGEAHWLHWRRSSGVPWNVTSVPLLRGGV